jgi:sensor histidine kinase YesM
LLENFLTQELPRFTNPKHLTITLVKLLDKAFRPASLCLWQPGDPLPEDLPEPEKLSADLREKNSFWTRSKALSSLNLSEESEKKLLATSWQLIFPFRTGLLCFGPTASGYAYNLSDIELITKALQQSELTLEILSLLEREKILVQQNLEATLIALRAQINPHFLFNTLNAISALIHYSPDQAEEATQKLAYILRYTLKNAHLSLTPAKDELDLIQAYLDIEQIRFGDRVEIDLEVDPNADLSTPVPAFAVSTLVENVFKHGVNKILTKGQVRILAQTQGSFLVFTIEDNGPGIDTSRLLNGTGIRNTYQRMEALYQQADLLTFENTGNGTRARLKIPLPQK